MTTAKRNAVAIRHVAFEDLGLLAPLLDAAAWNVSYREAAIDDLTTPAVANADLVIVLGGPIGAYEADVYPFLTKELALIEKRLAAGKPTLGICLGCQLMALALGARVYPGGRKEIGWGRVSLTDEGARSVLAPLAEPHAVALHWHGDTFDLPASASRLANNENYANQAFSVGAHSLALQFHLEADPGRMESWYVGHALELAANKVSIPALRADTQRVRMDVEEQAKRIFKPWLAALV